MTHMTAPRASSGPGSALPLFPVALAVYGALVLFLSFRQLDYLNADFVAYASIARCMLQHHGPWVSGYWSPFYSWCMIPWIALGTPDLIAGRLVLIMGGVLYVSAAYALTTRFRGDDPRKNRFLTTGVLCVAVLSAAVWTTALLDPDLLAAGFVYLVLFLLLDPDLDHRPGRIFGAGVIAGLAYLAKAVALPFMLLLLPLFLLMRRVTGSAPAPRFSALKIGVLFLAGLCLSAGPWIGILTAHYHALTLSTAGPSNHANMSPSNFRLDTLWNQGLAPGFIMDPHLTPDWSPIGGLPLLRHQARIFLFNAGNAAGHVAPWLGLAAVGGAVLASARLRRRRLFSPREGFGVACCLGAAAMFAGAYCMINVEARYIDAVVSPLLCLFALLVFAALATGRRKTSSWAYAQPAALALLIVFPLSLQELYRLERIAVAHPQCVRLTGLAEIAGGLAEAHVPSGPMAASQYHAGLGVAYAAGTIRAYLGAPLPGDAISLTSQLQSAGARTYLRWRAVSQPRLSDSRSDPAPLPPWHLMFTIQPTPLSPSPVEVYALGGD
jgi:hypothetical protein